MADVLAALKEAFGTFMKNIAGCLLYTLVFGIACAAALGIMLAIVFVLGIIAVGGAAGSLSLGSGTMVSFVFLGGAFLVLLLGVLIISWLMSGLIGSYYDALHSFLVARKPTLGGFFSGVPKKATPIFFAGLIQGLIVFVPAFLVTAIASFAGAGSGIAGMAVQAITGLYSAIIGFLTVFIIAAVVVDAKGAMSSVQHSMSVVSRNMIPMIIYAILSLLLALPVLLAIGVPAVLMALINNSLLQALLGLGVLFSLAYSVFFLMPLMALFNMSLYRKLK